MAEGGRVVGEREGARFGGPLATPALRPACQDVLLLLLGTSASGEAFFGAGKVVLQILRNMPDASFIPQRVAHVIRVQDLPPGLFGRRGGVPREGAPLRVGHLRATRELQVGALRSRFVRREARLRRRWVLHLGFLVGGIGCHMRLRCLHYGCLGLVLTGEVALLIQR